MRDGFEVYLKISEVIQNRTKIESMIVLLRLLNKDNESVLGVLKTSPSIKEKMRLMDRALDFAISNDSIKLAKLLLEASFEFSQSSIAESVNNGSIDMVELFLNYGADPNIVDRRGITLFREAATRGSTEIIDVLLKYGTKV